MSTNDDRLKEILSNIARQKAAELSSAVEKVAKAERNLKSSGSSGSIRGI